MFGKLLGGAFGFMVGGPFGALVGAAFGHNFDQGRWKTARASASTTADETKEPFYSSAFQLMGYIAKADGRVSEQEINAARAIMDHLQFSTEQRQIAIQHFTQGKQAEFMVGSAVATLQQLCFKHPALLQQVLEFLLNIAYADGHLAPQTHQHLLSITDQLGLHRLQFETLHTLFRAQHAASQTKRNGYSDYFSGADQQYYAHNRHATQVVNSLSQAYAVLGLRRDATTDEIKLAYRRLVKQHHPDKLASRNVSDTELNRATEKTREITAAYERIREARGF